MSTDLSFRKHTIAPNAAIASGGLKSGLSSQIQHIKNASSMHQSTSPIEEATLDSQNANGNPGEKDALTAFPFSPTRVSGVPGAAQTPAPSAAPIAAAAAGPIGRGVTMIRCIVFYPDGTKLTLEFDKSLTILLFTEQSLAALKKHFGSDSDFPSTLSTAPIDYRVYAAEEDGEVDDEYPALDDAIVLGNAGVDAFALVMKKGVQETLAKEQAAKGVAPMEMEDIKVGVKGKDDKDKKNGDGKNTEQEKSFFQKCCGCFGGK